MKKFLSVLMSFTLLSAMVSCTSKKAEIQETLKSTVVTVYNTISEISDDTKILFMITYMDEKYTTDEYLGNHLMIYYITTDCKAYSEFWTCDESTPFNSNSCNEFKNAQELGSISEEELLKYYNTFLNIDFDKLAYVQDNAESAEYAYTYCYGFNCEKDGTESLEAIYKNGKSVYQNTDSNCIKVMEWLNALDSYNQAQEIWQNKYSEVQ